MYIINAILDMFYKVDFFKKNALPHCRQKKNIYAARNSYKIVLFCKRCIVSLKFNTFAI